MTNTNTKTKTMTKTMTKTKTQTKCLKNPTYAIFLKSWWLTHSKYDDRYLTLVILFTLVTWLACSGHTISSTEPSVSPFWDFYVLCLKTRSRYQLRPGNPSVTGLLRWDWWRGDHPRDNLNQATPEILMKSTAGLSRELWVGPRFKWQSFSGFCIFSNPWVLINSVNSLAIRVFYISQKEVIYLKRCLTLNFSF